MEDRYLIKMPMINAKSVINPYFVEVIGQKTHISWRKAVEKIAWYFKREFQYDFVQYLSDDCENAYAYLFLNPQWLINGKMKVIGACCFRYCKDYENLNPFWSLQWIWIHPFERNKKILSRNWTYFENKYGNNFIVEQPLSIEMRYFLKRKKCFTRHTDYYQFLKDG